MRNGVARGRVLKAVAKTWPGVIMNTIETRAREHIDAGRFDEGASVFFFGAMARTLIVLAAISAMLLAELGALQHLGVLVVIALGYLDWYRVAVRVNAG